MNLKAKSARILGIDGIPIALAFAAVTAYFALTVPSFVDADSLRYYVNEEVPLFIITAGMALVIIAGGIDLSVGSVLGLSAGVSLYTSMKGFPMPVAVLAGVGTGLAFGALNGFMIVKLRLNDFIVTLGTLNVAAGLLVVLTDHVQIVGTDDASFLAITNKTPFGIPIAIVISAVVVLVLHVVLTRTVFGRRVTATGLGRGPALIAGVDVGRVKYATYLISGGLAGFGGVLISSHLNSVQPGLAGGYELATIAAAVLGGVSLAGGRGGIWQAALGALLLVTLKQGFRLMGVDPLIYSIITGGCILVGVIADRVLRRLAVSMDAPTPVQSVTRELVTAGESK